ncbi:hypothetical protein AURDEDRAFT_21155, partial [Auricularia subglabra TFB-10046 SS5]
IEVQRCGSCPPQSRQYAGPDLRELGIFNFNNTRLFTHELMNKYTSSMTASETPFHAYHTEICREYQVSESPVKFVGSTNFRTVFYAFARLQQLDDSWVCDVCGAEPEVLVVDGTSIGYKSSNCTHTLRPPTFVGEDAIRRASVLPPK